MFSRNPYHIPSSSLRVVFSRTPVHIPGCFRALPFTFLCVLAPVRRLSRARSSPAPLASSRPARPRASPPRSARSSPPLGRTPRAESRRRPLHVGAAHHRARKLSSDPRKRTQTRCARRGAAAPVHRQLVRGVPRRAVSVPRPRAAGFRRIPTQAKRAKVIPIPPQTLPGGPGWRAVLAARPPGARAEKKRKDKRKEEKEEPGRAAPERERPRARPLFYYLCS